jgi:hypothetical protein
MVQLPGTRNSVGLLPFLWREKSQCNAKSHAFTLINQLFMAELNPQPLPPKIELSAFTEAVSASVIRAIESQSREFPKNSWRNSRIICGFILEPPVFSLQEKQ